ncbi:DUF4158 domain-containing protein [Nonomuraea dietziae]
MPAATTPPPHGHMTTHSHFRHTELLCGWWWLPSGGPSWTRSGRQVIGRSRQDSHRLGVAIQIGAVRHKGLFLEDAREAPWPAWTTWLTTQRSIPTLGLGTSSGAEGRVDDSRDPQAGGGPVDRIADRFVR